MKNFIVLYITLFSFFSYSQNKVYKYYIHLYNSNLTPEFFMQNGNYKYRGNDVTLQLFFNNYNIIKFEKEFPMTNWESFSKILRLETTNENLANDLIKFYPNTYKKFDDLTNDVKAELLFYPNDYGTTSPNINVGADIQRRDLDYMQVHKAWDITTGQGMKIGISDARINTTDLDFVNKVSFINPGNYLPFGLA